MGWSRRRRPATRSCSSHRPAAGGAACAWCERRARWRHRGRMQVEHRVTEAIPGIDLIREQTGLAAGEPLRLRQEEIAFNGHAIEFRINAEDANDNFAPQTGVIEELQLPAGPGVRVDTHLYPGYEVPPFYDSLLAKLIVWGETREDALALGRRALNEFPIGGVGTHPPFHPGIVNKPALLE